MNDTRRLFALFCAVVLVIAPGSVAFAQSDGSDDTSPVTDLTFSGSLSSETSGSNANACVLQDGDFRVQLAGVGSASLLSLDVANAAVGTYPIQRGVEPLVQMITLSDDSNELLVNWYGQAGTLTISSLDTSVAIDDGSAATHGASGSIDADIAADKHGTVHVSGPWACHLPA